MTTAFIFPGQGSQAVGMGRALTEAFPVARHTMQEVDDALNQHLARLMFEGPEPDLTLTENTQPAIMACSVAALRVMETELGMRTADAAACVAGHSLGEYAALTAAGSLALADTARLLKTRGQAMQAAVPAGQGMMAAIIGLDVAKVQTACAEAAGDGEVCEIANYNSEQQIVISGSVAGVERAMAILKDVGAKRAVPLPVSAPFHCSLMQPAAETMRQALAAAAIHAPQVPLIANVTAQPVEDPGAIRDLLVQQVTHMVRWQESVETMVQRGVTRFVEIGHGKVLSGLVKRIAPDAACVNLAAPEDVERLAQAT